MPITITKTAYRFAELSDEAKEKAVEWMCQKLSEWLDANDLEFVIDDFVEIAKRLGLEIATRPVQLVSGKTGQKPSIFWTGFWSQGDGACFEGRWYYTPGLVEAVKEWAPQDKDLHRIAAELEEAYEKAGKPSELGCNIKHRGHYYHERSMDYDFFCGESGYDDIPNGVEDQIKEAFVSLAQWLYRTIEAEYEYQTSEEMAKERLTDDDPYLFNEDGSPFRD